MARVKLFEIQQSTKNATTTNMKKSRPTHTSLSSNLKEEEDDENVVDRISNLPDPILELILSRLPTTKQVIQTSILSKRWKYLWTSIPYFPSLDFDCSRPPINFKQDQFQEFVSWALGNKTADCNLESFRLHCSGYYNLSTLIGWIGTAIMRKVKFLDLMLRSDNYYKDIVLPHSLITCETLEELRMDLCGQCLCLLKCARFAALRVLELKSVSPFHYSLIETFLESCPLLEDLSLECMFGLSNVLMISSMELKALRIRNLPNVDSVKVSCPKLEVLEYAGFSGRLFIKECRDSLKKAVIVFKDEPQNQISSDLANTICTLFAEISNVESLSLNLPFIQCLGASWDLHGYLPALLPNLKTLEITTTIDAFSMNTLIRILRYSPNLKSLHLIFQKEFLRTSKYWDFDEVKTRKMLTRHLKRVEFLDFNGEKWRLDIARSLLEHGKALEEMVFRWLGVKCIEKSRETMHELSTFNKASSTVKLITLRN